MVLHGDDRPVEPPAFASDAMGRLRSRRGRPVRSPPLRGDLVRIAIGRDGGEPAAIESGPASRNRRSRQNRTTPALMNSARSNARNGPQDGVGEGATRDADTFSLLGELSMGRQPPGQVVQICGPMGGRVGQAILGREPRVGNRLDDLPQDLGVQQRRELYRRPRGSRRPPAAERGSDRGHRPAGMGRGILPGVVDVQAEPWSISHRRDARPSMFVFRASRSTLLTKEVEPDDGCARSGGGAKPAAGRSPARPAGSPAPTLTPLLRWSSS